MRGQRLRRTRPCEACLVRQFPAPSINHNTKHPSAPPSIKQPSTQQPLQPLPSQPTVSDCQRRHSPPSSQQRPVVRSHPHRLPLCALVARPPSSVAREPASLGSSPPQPTPAALPSAPCLPPTGSSLDPHSPSAEGAKAGTRTVNHNPRVVVQAQPPPARTALASCRLALLAPFLPLRTACTPVFPFVPFHCIAQDFLLFLFITLFTPLLRTHSHFALALHCIHRSVISAATRVRLPPLHYPAVPAPARDDITTALL